MSEADKAIWQELSGKRILIIEEALKSTSGHFFEYDRAVKEASEALGAEVVIAGHRDMDTHVRDALGAEAVFPRTCWDIGFGDMGQIKRQWEILRHNLMFFTTVRRLLKSMGPFDVVFAPTVTIYHAPAMALLARMTPAARARRFVSFFRNSIGNRRPDGSWSLDKLKRFVWRKVFGSLFASRAAGRAAQVTDSTRLAEEYRSLAGAELTVLPHPSLTVRAVIPPRDGAEAPFVFGHLGPPRLEKGIDILFDAIETFLVELPEANARFLIQWNSEVRLPDGSCMAPGEVLSGDDRVSFIERALSSEDYVSFLQRIDCMVLPYRSDAYSSRISGIAVEAVSAGQCLITTEDTWSSDLLGEFGEGQSVPDGDAQALTKAMRTIFEQRHEMSGSAREKSAGARRFHSTDSFIRMLWSEA